MPIHSYVCKNGHTFEERLTFAAADKRVPCPECKSAGKRQISGFTEQNSSRNRRRAAPTKQKFHNW